MDSAMYDMLKEKLSETTYGDGEDAKSLFDLVIDWEDGLTKTKGVNKDLTRQREEWQAMQKEYKSKLAELEEAIKNKQPDNILSDEDRKKIEKMKAGGYIPKEEMDLKVNELLDKVDKLTQRIEQAETEKKEQLRLIDEEKKSYTSEKLRGDLYSALSKYGVIGPQADAAFGLLTQQGKAGVKKNEEGKYVYHLVNTKDGRTMSTTLDKLCEDFVSENQWAVSSSGKKGPGDNHQSSTNSGRAGSFYSMIQNK